MVPNFANSDGWNKNPAILNHDVDPLIVWSDEYHQDQQK